MSKRVLDALGVTLQPVLGDGNCLFRTFAALAPDRDHRAWRNALCDSMEAKANSLADHDNRLQRANDVLKDKPLQEGESSPQYQTFQDLLQAWRRNEWPTQDFITEFAEFQQAVVLCLEPTKVAIYRPSNPDAPIQHQYCITIHKAPDTGDTPACVIVCSSLLCTT